MYFIATDEKFRIESTVGLITDINLSTFVGIGSLEELDLSENRMITVRDNTFINTPYLVSLELWDNQISIIESSAFSGL